jgi:hypothetical protein
LASAIAQLLSKKIRIAIFNVAFCYIFDTVRLVKQKRMLIDIYPEFQRELLKIRNDCKRKGRRVPSLPMLVNDALKLSIGSVRAAHVPDGL